MRGDEALHAASHRIAAATVASCGTGRRAGVALHSMKLETADSYVFDQVTEEQLRDTFDDDKGRGEFVILSEKPEVYIQASGEGDGPYALEYRDGDADHHF